MPLGNKSDVKFEHVRYSNLTARQKENFNFAKISAVLADFGYTTFRLSDDWKGADFIAVHVTNTDPLFVQLKGRCTLQKSYEGKDLWIAFPNEKSWYLYRHDNVLEQLREDIGQTISWKERGEYSYPRLTKQLVDILSHYQLEGDTEGNKEGLPVANTDQSHFLNSKR